MKATILIPFRDKHDHKVVYAPGDVKEFDNDRVVALAARGLVKPLEEAPKTPSNNENAEAEAKPAKGKGKGKKSTKKDKDLAEDVASEPENVDADTDTDHNAEADAGNSEDKE